MSNLDTVAYLKAGRVFTASNVSAKIITVVATSTTGLVLNNPIGSNKLLVLMSASFAMTTDLGSLAAISIAMNAVQGVATTGTVGTAISKSASGGSAASVAQAWDTATFAVAPVSICWPFGKQWITGGNSSSEYTYYAKIDGDIGVLPGAAICFAGIGGTLPTGMGAFNYIEVDI